MENMGITSKFRLRFQDRHKWMIAGLLLAVLLLGAFLRFYRLGESGIGNTYYAATVKSMLVSWKNFFFVAFEPGGSVSVDKPPLGFWVQALSAYFLGVNGFALALPNAISGVLSIFLIYKLIRRPFGPWAGLVAALTLAVMPVAISTERNNTIDGLLVLVLLLAAWAFLHAVRTGKVRWLFLGALIVGLGFNIKMLQAYLPLPAFYALYLFGAKQRWGEKVLHLAMATVILLIFSFSWAVAVDLTPAGNRPYVDSTSNNTVMELIFGHNGIERLTNLRQGMGFAGGPGQPPMQDEFSSAIPQDRLPDGEMVQPPGGRNIPRNGLPQPPAGQPFAPGGLPQPPARQGVPQAFGNDGQFSPMINGGQPGGGAGSMDFGTAGALRLFTEPLVGEASWLLPFVLGGLVALAAALWKRPFGVSHISAILWIGWLLPETFYFTYSQGLMHAYYLIMMGAPIAALVAITIWSLWQIIQKRGLLGWSISAILVAGTLIFQVQALWGKVPSAIWPAAGAGILFGVGLALAAASSRRVRLAPVALGFLLAAMLVAPAVWSASTTFNVFSNNALPYAGPARHQGDPTGMTAPVGDNGGVKIGGSDLNRNLLNYLLANTDPGTYLLATGRANDAAAYILETGRPVLTFGGFLGQYDEVSVTQLTALVDSDRLRFVLSQGLQQHQEILRWVQQNCTAVDRSAWSGSATPVSDVPGGGAGNGTLYDCGG